MRLFVLSVFVLTMSSLKAQYDHVSIFSELDDEALRQALVNDYRPQSVLSLSEARDTLYAKVHYHQDSVRCVYTNHSKFLDLNLDPSQALFENGGPTDINLEHGYPQGKGADFGAANSDMHHLFPSRVLVNTARGNDPMTEIPDNQVVRWFYKDQTRSSQPSGDLSVWSEDADVEFEPREDFKGNIARAYFYFYTMYGAQADQADPNYFESQRETLCEWHDLDPVDSLEWARTYKIAEYQAGKVNPFVLDCRLARLYCGDISSACSTVNTEDEEDLSFRLFPNPCQREERLFITENHNPVSITIIDSAGRIINRSKHISLRAPGLPGSYTLLLKTSAGIKAQHLIVL